MEMPDSVNLTRMVTVSNGSSRIKIVEKEYKGGEPYYHSRIVEALKSENEELKDKLSETVIHLAARNSEIEVLKAKLPKCKCTFAQKTVGDGCQVCNPQMAIDMLSEQVEELKAKLDKAIDALEQISRMAPLPDHKSNTMTLVACREIASIALGNKSIVHALRKHKAMNSIYPDAPEQP